MMFRIIALFFALIIGFSLQSQIIQHNADTTLPVDYNQQNGSDSILIIFGPAPSGFTDTLTITAFSPWEKIDSLKWYAIEANTTDTILEKTLLAQGTDTSLTLKTITPGGLQAQFWLNGNDTTITRWAFFNDLVVNLFYEESCDELLLQGIQGGNTFSYFHPDSIFKVYIEENDLKLTWKDFYLDDDTQQWMPLDSLDFDEHETTQFFSTPPINYKTYLFKVNVEDSLGHSGIDSIVYDAIAVKADFKASQNGIEINKDSLKFEAPLKMGFINKSLNTEIQQWTFFNDTGRISKGADTVLKYSDFYEPLDSIYYKYPGYYDVKLKVEGRIFEQNEEEKKCKDSLRKRLYITVYNSFLGELPNAITPNNDQTNDVFYFKNIEKWDYEDLEAPKDLPTTSIREFKVYIYNRYGLRVYHFEGSQWTKHDAWNGRYNGNIVGSGVYFYVIKAHGYDGRKFEQKGFFHVYSGK